MAELSFERARFGVRRLDLSLLLVGAIIIVTTVLRFTVGASQPLWIDEAWTGMVIRQPTFGLFLHQTFSDTNAPLYYFVAAALGLVTGYSDAAMRFPAALFGALTPLIALRMPLPGPRAVRLLWTVLVACWIPGIWYSQDARCYTLLVLFATLNVPLFCRLMEAPSRTRFAQWAGAAALMILTHYYAGLLIGIQFLALTAFRRKWWSSIWPGMALFLPAAISMAVSAPKFLLFSDEAVSWIHLVSWTNVYILASHVAGGLLLPAAIVLWAAVCGTIGLVGRMRQRTPEPPHRIPLPLIVAAVSSLAAVATALAVGTIKPVVYERYLISFAPGVLLGLACLGVGYFDQRRTASTLLAGFYVAMTLLWAAMFWRGYWPLEIETASGYLMKHHPSRVVFLWDEPFMLNLARKTDNFEAITGTQKFFFDRAGDHTPIEAIDVPQGRDPNLVFLRASRMPGTAILWVYDSVGERVNGREFPPVLQHSGRFACHDFGKPTINVLACYAR